ncbi:WD40 repeat domain-containing protein [Streptomyces sp. NPDC059881]|uniref:WD40 repeat domain-containing protein n=1 Tax=Streptomyces sp. NPDC059881 TaxID=3346986 RepID=UPI003652EAF4
MRVAVWSIADQLGVVARAPQELVAALGRDLRRSVIVLPDLHDGDVAELVLDLVKLPHVRLIVESRSDSPAHRLLSKSACAELNLDLEQWRDERRFEMWQEALPVGRDTAQPGQVDTATGLDLSDPIAVCEADPWVVTAAYDSAGDHEHGGLRAAWLRAGQALCREQRPVSRALTLLSVLGDSTDPRVALALSEVAAGADWRVEWRRVRGDVVPAWPGPVETLAVGRGPLSGSVLTVGANGVVKAVSLADAEAFGRLSPLRSRPVAMSVLPDGTVLVLARNGRVEAVSEWATRSASSGLAMLLDDGPTDTQRLLDSLRGHAGTALAHATGKDLGIVALGDSTGTVRLFGDVVASAGLHDGPVNALTAVALPLDGEVSAPLFYSGGTDGIVRAWSPGGAPMTAPVLRRPCPVVSLDATVTKNGPAIVVAWGDGMVECIYWETGVQQTFRPGPPVRSVALDDDGRVLIGMDEALTCLAPQQQSADGDVVQQRMPVD